MGFLSKALNKQAFKLSDDNAVEFFRNIGLDTTGIGSQSELNEAIYFICLKHLSETMSKMPWVKRRYTQSKGKEKEIDNDIDVLLNVRPNAFYTAAVFWATVELNKNHYGNAYSYIEFRKGKPKHLWILPSKEIEVWRDDGGVFGKNKNAIWYIWNDSQSNKKYKFSSDEILHFKSHITFNGLVGLSVKDILKSQITSRLHAQKFLSKLYASNMFGSKVLVHYSGEIKPGGAKKVAKEIESFSSDQGSGKFIPLPPGFTAQLLDMKLSDAQFHENSMLSALQIAAAFGIKPNVINDYTKSSYRNSESQQLDFYVNTLQPLFNSYQQECTYKMLPYDDMRKGLRLEINENILFKMDSRTRADVFTKYANNFIMSPNDIREELNLPYVEGGSELIGNGNYIKLNQVGDQWKKEGDNNENN